MKINENCVFASRNTFRDFQMLIFLQIAQTTIYKNKETNETKQYTI